jgi:ABC-type branched-subunit amino acid transport system permease subunit
VLPALHPYLALAIAASSARLRADRRLPALRLRTFYFAITTLGFATIVTQIALAWQSVTGGGVGVPGRFPAAVRFAMGLLLFLLRPRGGLHLDDDQHRGSRFGRALTAIRDAEVAAEACGIPSRAADDSCSCSAARSRGIAAGCSRRCSPTSRRTPSRSSCRCCSSSRS